MFFLSLSFSICCKPLISLSLSLFFCLSLSLSLYMNMNLQRDLSYDLFFSYTPSCYSSLGHYYSVTFIDDLSFCCRCFLLMSCSLQPGFFSFSIQIKSLFSFLHFINAKVTFSVSPFSLSLSLAQLQ